MTRPKTSDRALLPKGMATLLPEATAVRRRLEHAAFSVFRSWGYEEVVTPLFEYLDVIAPGLGPGLVEKAGTVAGRGAGAELTGPSNPSAGAEVVARAMEVLGPFALPRAAVAMGPVGFFQGWLAAT